MKIEGTYSFNANRRELWDTLLDTGVLASCIPGCQEFKPVGDDKYELSLRVGLGAITGTYKAAVAVVDKDEPNTYTMLVEGKGSGTTISGRGVMTLTETESGSVVRIEGDARVTGIIARVGQRLMGGASKVMIDQFFACVKTRADG
jgi:carbon monoxide dehydrogenase subunit G